MDMVRKKKMVTMTLEPATVERLEAWLATQEFPPAKNAVIEAALHGWLSEREARKAALDEMTRIGEDLDAE